MFEYTEELTVYGLTVSDYKTDSNQITGVVDETWNPWGDIKDHQVQDWFDQNKHTTKPNPDYTAPGHGKLVANDLSATLQPKFYSDVDAMKTAVLSDSYISTINTYAAHADYYMSADSKLTIKLFFETEAKRNSWLNAVKDRPSTQFKEPGTVVTVI